MKSSFLSILIVDDDEAVGAVLGALCRQRGLQATWVASGAAALAALERAPFDAAIVDLRMPGMSGLELLARMSASWPETPVIMLTAHGSVDDAVRAMKLGAVEFMSKPFDRDELFFVIERATARAAAPERPPIVASTPSMAPAATTAGAAPVGRMLGDAPVMQAVYDLVRRAASSSATVLVRGESGTGKELVARAIHAESARAAMPFVKIHCAALPDNLLESELFGYEKGAFTGAAARKPGRIELADRGTVFLDEIGDISPATQVKLLRVLQDKELERLGGTATLKVDVRFVTATHRDLEDLVHKGQFREDLFYRLNVVPIWLPPLRARASDIPGLARTFFEEALREHGRRDLALAPDALADLATRPWPGNVRQLKNVVERIAVLAPGPLVSAADVERELARDRAVGAPEPVSTAPVAASSPAATLDSHVDQAELQAIQETLERCGNNRTLAARLLGVSRRTLYNKLARHGIA
ncbi:MAG: sigma-54-dependent Fis family transcriptional regulator [Deltaproteobacteria bacterium]|nr:sigma-54-dependent Fis family transcriptional regulator [Deltaproteobacteria bacterium]